MNAEDVGRLQPRPGAGQCAHDHLLVGHGPLHGGGGELHEHLLGCSWPYRPPPEKRTLYLLSGADRLCAPYSPGLLSLTVWVTFPRLTARCALLTNPTAKLVTRGENFSHSMSVRMCAPLRSA